MTPTANPAIEGSAGDYPAEYPNTNIRESPRTDSQYPISVETAGNLQLLANSFTGFVVDLHPNGNDA